MFSWSEYIPQEVVNGFTKETGIKVVLSTYESNEAMYAKLKLLGAKGYDLVVPSGYFVEVMAQDNLLAKLDKSKIKATFGVKIPHWTESLKVCMKNLKNFIDHESSYDEPC